MKSLCVTSCPLCLIISVNILEQFFHRRLGACFCKLYGLVHFFFHARIDLIQCLGAGNLLFDQMFAEDSDRVTLLPLLNFFLFAITLRVTHRMTTEAIGIYLKEIRIAVLTY